MKKLKPPFEFQIGKCYRVRAFETKHLYRVEVLKLWPNGCPHGDYRTHYKDTNRYGPITRGGTFDLIIEAIEIPHL